MKNVAAYMTQVVKNHFFQEKKVLPRSDNLKGNNTYVKFWSFYVIFYG